MRRVRAAESATSHVNDVSTLWGFNVRSEMARSKHRSKRFRRGIRSLLPKARWKRWIVGGAVLGSLALVAFVWSLSRKVDDFLSGRAPGPIRIYSAPFVMRPGMSTEGARLVARLRRLGYSDAAGEQLETGSF